MPLILTAPLLGEISSELKRKIERAYAEFPELVERRVTVGITRKRWLDGYTVAEDFCVRLNSKRRTGVSYFTVGHEFTLPISEFTITRQAKSGGRSVFEDGVTDPNGPAIRRVVSEFFEKTARPHTLPTVRVQRGLSKKHTHRQSMGGASSSRRPYRLTSAGGRSGDKVWATSSHRGISVSRLRPTPRAG